MRLFAHQTGEFTPLAVCQTSHMRRSRDRVSSAHEVHLRLNTITT
jgi:hypothetical protein